MANTKFQIKRSVVPGKTPLNTDLEIGELALNLSDKKIFSKHSLGDIITLSDFELSNSAHNIARSAFIQANAAYIQANAAQEKANTKTYNFYESVAPTSPNSRDFWTNSNTGIVYENFGTSLNPIWAEFGPTGTIQINVLSNQANTTANVGFEQNFLLMGA